MANNNSKLMQFAKGTAVLVISNLFIKATNFFLLPLYTAYLLPEQLGISDSITSIMAIVFPLLVVAFDSSFSAFFYDQDSLQYREKVFNTTFTFLLFSSTLTLIPMLFSSRLSVLLFGTEQYHYAILISMLSVAVNMWFLPFSLLIRIENRMMTFSIISFIASFSMICFNIFFVVVLNLGYISLIISNLLVNILQLILFGAFARIRLNLRQFDKCLYRKMLRYSLPLLPMVLANWMLSLSDRYIILYHLGEHEVGLYGIATRFLNVLVVMTSALQTAFASFAFSSNKDKNAKAQYVFTLDAVCIFLLGISLTVSVFAHEILTIMVSAEYQSADRVIGPLIMGQVCYAANTIMGYGFAFKKKSSYYLFPTFLGAGINIVLNLLLIPQYGIYAAAVTTFAGYFLMMITTYVLSQRVYSCKYHIKRLLCSLLICITVVTISACASLSIRILSYIGAALCVCYVYRDTLKILCSYAGKVIRRHPKERQ